MKTKSLITKGKNTVSDLAATIKGNQTILYVGGGLLGGYLLYKLISAVNSVTGGISDAIKDDPNSGGGNVDIPLPGNTPKNATINNVQAQTAASIILAAVDGFGKVGTKEFETIKKVFQGRNILDYIAISKAFGFPRRSIITGEESVWFLGGEKLNMTQWLTLELSPDQLEELKRIIPEVF